MKLKSTLYRKRIYLPSKRHRNKKQYYSKHEVALELKELKREEEFPVAFVTKTLKSVTEATDYNAYKEVEKNSEYRIFQREYRFHKGNFYKAVYFQFGAVISTSYVKPEEELKKIGRCCCDYYSYFDEAREPLPNDAVILSDNMEEQYQKMQSYLDSRYLFYAGALWERCEEPCYDTSYYSSDKRMYYSVREINRNDMESKRRGGICKKDTFYALEKESLKALVKASGAPMRTETIEVLLPEVVSKETGIQMSHQLLSIIESTIAFAEFVKLHQKTIGNEPSEEYIRNRAFDYFKTLVLPEGLSEAEPLFERIITLPGKYRKEDLQGTLWRLEELTEDEIKGYMLY